MVSGHGRDRCGKRREVGLGYVRIGFGHIISQRLILKCVIVSPFSSVHVIVFSRVPCAPHGILHGVQSLHGTHIVSVTDDCTAE